MSKQFTVSEVAQHKTADNGMYIIVGGSVYDITQFQDEHPGGKKILARQAGKDATNQFKKFHNDHVLSKYDRLKVGTVKEEAKL